MATMKVGIILQWCLRNPCSTLAGTYRLAYQLFFGGLLIHNSDSSSSNSNRPSILLLAIHSSLPLALVIGGVGGRVMEAYHVLMRGIERPSQNPKHNLFYHSYLAEVLTVRLPLSSQWMVQSLW